MYRYILPVLLLIVPAAASAQKGLPKEKKIRCTVVDAKSNKPIKGLSIQLHDNEDKAETTGSSFSVTITNPQQVEVSAPGYVTDVVLVNDKDKCLVKLRKEGSSDEDGDDAADGHNDVDAKDDADDD